MKKLLFALCLLCTAAIAAQAQDTTSTQSQQPQTQEQPSSDYRTDDATQQDDEQYTDKEVIANNELPSTITAQLQGQDYTGWTVSKAFRKTKDGQTIYAVELTNGDEKKKVKFDAMGNVLKEKHKDNDNR